MKNYYPAYPVEPELFAEEEEKDEDPVEAPRDETFAYLQKIAKTPLLDPEQETALFEKYQEGLQLFATKLNELPKWMLASLNIAEKNAPNNTHKFEPPQSEHGLIISQIRAEIQALGVLLDKLETKAKLLKQARWKIFEGNLHLLKKYVDETSPPELMQAGSLGLLQAIDDGTKRGAAFRTYARQTIRRSISAFNEKMAKSRQQSREMPLTEIPPVRDFARVVLTPFDEEQEFHAFQEYDVIRCEIETLLEELPPDMLPDGTATRSLRHCGSFSKTYETNSHISNGWWIS